MAKEKSSVPTSWEPVEKWYRGTVGDEGHYYHQRVILPRLEELMALGEETAPAVLDLACGEGILSRSLPKGVKYMGIDISPSLIRGAEKNKRDKEHKFALGDVSKKLPTKEVFSHAAIILALQNIEHPDRVLNNAARHLRPGGKVFIVINHPCFRIPRQTSWGVDQEKKIQYRRVDRYLSPLKIPILANPSKGKESAQTWSFHHSLTDYSRWLWESGFSIERLEEWCSDKTSEGGAARMENRSRKEFPLFLAIVARKEVENAPS